MLRRLISPSALACALVGLVQACSWVHDPDALGRGDGASDGGTASDAPRDAARSSVEDAPAANGCASREGPPAVRIGDFCVDSTEVTREQYARFLDAVGVDAGGPATAPQCAGNKSLAPVQSFPPVATAPSAPVVGVDWCDALAYCTWAGKRLCGSLTGGPLTKQEAASPSVSLWYKACSADGTARFAYGDGFERGRCNVDSADVVGAGTSRCTGGYPGLYDMVGNAAEWLDGCEPPFDSSTFCLLAGGSFTSGEAASCGSISSVQGTIPWPSAGIRCCAPAIK